MLLADLERRLPDSAGTTAVVVMDLDQFGELSTYYGVEAGNQMLDAVFARVRAWASTLECCDVFRLEGDRFALVMPQDAADGIDRLVDEMRRPTLAGGLNIRITASFGLARYPGDAALPTDLVKSAEIAVKAAKRAGRNCYRYYRPEMWLDFANAASIRQEALDGLEKGEFMLFYQPVIDIRQATARVSGFEALLRWQHPDRGVLGPGAFQPALADEQFAEQVGLFVAAAAARQAASWHAAAVPFGSIAINASGPDLRSGRFLGTLLNKIRAHGLRSHHFRVEITEDILLGTDSDRVRGTLEQMHNAGLHLSLDDFGTGFASLSHLQTLPVSTVKLDKSYVTGLGDDHKKRAIVKGVVGIAHSIGLSVIAEGVETQSDLVELSRLDCDEVQGFLIARPMPACDVASFLLAANGSLQRAITGRPPREAAAGQFH